MGSITLQGVRKSFGPVNVISGADLEIANGSFVVFVGPSGCGKTTLLRLIAGLEDVTDGRILIDGVNVVNVPPAKRGLSMVFQSYALYPHMSVRSNIGFGLKMAGLQRSEIALKACDLYAHVDSKSGIEIRQWFVEQKRFRLSHDRAPDRDPLPLAAR